MRFAPQDVAQSDMADECRIFKQAKVIGLALCMQETQVKIVWHLLRHVKALRRLNKAKAGLVQKGSCGVFGFVGEHGSLLKIVLP